MLTNSTPQTLPSQINGVCIPQRIFSEGTLYGHNQNTVLFIRLDGTYIPVDAALNRNYTGLIGRNEPVFAGAGYTITLRLKVG